VKHLGVLLLPFVVTLVSRPNSLWSPSAEGCFPFVSGLDAYIIEIPADVQFCEVLGSAELRDKFRDEGEQISVFDGYGV